MLLSNTFTFFKINNSVSTFEKAIHFYESNNILDHAPNNFYATHSLFLKLREISPNATYFVPEKHVLLRQGSNYRARFVSIVQPKNIVTLFNSSRVTDENELSDEQALCTGGWDIQKSGSTNIDLTLGVNDNNKLKFQATNFERWGGGPRIIVDASKYDGKTVSFSVEEVTISGLSSKGTARLMIEDRKGEPGNYSHQADSYYFEGNGTYKNISVTRNLRSNINQVSIAVRVNDDLNEIVTVIIRGVKFGLAYKPYYNLVASDILFNHIEHEIHKGVLWDWPGHARAAMHDKSTSWEIYTAKHKVPRAFLLISSENLWRFFDLNLIFSI